MTTSRCLFVGDAGDEMTKNRLPATAVVAEEEDLVAVGFVEVGGRILRAIDRLDQLKYRSHRDWLRKRGYSISAGVAEQFGRMEVYGALEQALVEHEPDYVIAAVPTAALEGVVTTVNRFGCHLLTEPPMPPGDYARHRLVAEARGLWVIGYHLQYQLKRARDAIQAGALGDQIKARISWVCADRIPDDPHLWEDPATGGVNRQFGDLEAALVYLFGEPLEARGASFSNERGRAQFGDAFKAEDTVEVEEIVFAEAEVELVKSWAYGGTADEEILFEAYGEDTKREARLVPQKAEDYVAQSRNLIRAGKGLEPPRQTAEETLPAEHLLDGIRVCASRGGAPVSFRNA